MRAMPSWKSVLLIFAAAAVCPAQNGEADKIRDVIHAYEKSIDAADPALGARVWSTSADVTFIHPLGEEHGWEQIKSNVYEKLMGGLFSERRLTASDIEIHVDGDAAWAQFHWVFVAKMRSDGSPAKTEGRETQIYHKTPGGWRIVHVHYSEMPRPR